MARGNKNKSASKGAADKAKISEARGTEKDSRAAKSSETTSELEPAVPEANETKDAGVNAAAQNDDQSLTNDQKGTPEKTIVASNGEKGLDAGKPALDTTASAASGIAQLSSKESEARKTVETISDTAKENSGKAEPTEETIVESHTAAQVDALGSMSPEEREAELRSQVTSLNTKLVSAINRMSDLEDELSVTQNTLAVKSSRLDELSKERDQYISALDTGLLVEKSHVTSEMQRMMERVVDETAQRGKAENDRTRIEAELEELSASLFNEANKMVAVERLQRTRVEERSRELEATLHDTERIMADHQDMLKSLQSEIEVLRRQPITPTFLSQAPSELAKPTLHIFVNVPPYQEFLAFLAYLRSLQMQLEPYFMMSRNGVDWTTAPPSSPAPFMGSVMASSSTNSLSATRHRDYPHLPMSAEQLVHVSSQTSLPFIRRMLEEDTDPCLRLAQAPGLNWLARRQASAAVLDGDVMIEPIFAGGIVPDERAIRDEYGALPPVPCAICSTPLLNVTSVMDGTSSSSTSDANPSRSNSISWSNSSGRRGFPSLFQTLRRSHTERSRTPPIEPEGKDKEQSDSSSRGSASWHADSLPIPTHYFRLSDQATNRYLLCAHNCLYRLRAICAVWAFVRTLERSIVLEGKYEPDMVGQIPADRSRASSSSASRSSCVVNVPNEASHSETQPLAQPTARRGVPAEVPPDMDPDDYETHQNMDGAKEAAEAGEASEAKKKDDSEASKLLESSDTVNATGIRPPKKVEEVSETSKDERGTAESHAPPASEAETVTAPKPIMDTNSNGTDVQPSEDRIDSDNAVCSDSKPKPRNEPQVSDKYGESNGSGKGERSKPDDGELKPPPPPKILSRTTSSASPAPILPTATLSRVSFQADPDRSGLSWEDSLWMEVLRYKELLWKVRVGVDLESLDIV